jgi:hypothetical protein
MRLPDPRSARVAVLLALAALAPAVARAQAAPRTRADVLATLKAGEFLDGELSLADPTSATGYRPVFLQQLPTAVGHPVRRATVHHGAPAAFIAGMFEPRPDAAMWAGGLLRLRDAAGHDWRLSYPWQEISFPGGAPGNFAGLKKFAYQITCGYADGWAIGNATRDIAGILGDGNRAGPVVLMAAQGGVVWAWEDAKGARSLRAPLPPRPAGATGPDVRTLGVVMDADAGTVTIADGGTVLAQAATFSPPLKPNDDGAWTVGALAAGPNARSVHDTGGLLYGGSRMAWTDAAGRAFDRVIPPPPAGDYLDAAGGMLIDPAAQGNQLWAACAKARLADLDLVNDAQRGAGVLIGTTEHGLDLRRLTISRGHAAVACAGMGVNYPLILEGVDALFPQLVAFHFSNSTGVARDVNSLRPQRYGFQIRGSTLFVDGGMCAPGSAQVADVALVAQADGGKAHFAKYTWDWEGIWPSDAHVVATAAAAQRPGAIGLSFTDCFFGDGPKVLRTYGAAPARVAPRVAFLRCTTTADAPAIDAPGWRVAGAPND